MGSNKENEQTDQVQLLHQQKLINNPPIPQPVKKAEAFEIALSPPPPPASKVPTPSVTSQNSQNSNKMKKKSFFSNFGKKK